MDKTLKIRLLVAVAGEYAYRKGEVVDAPEDRALDLIKAGHAELVAEKPVTKAENAMSAKAANAETR